MTLFTDYQLIICRNNPELNFVLATAQVCRPRCKIGLAVHQHSVEGSQQSVKLLDSSTNKSIKGDGLATAIMLP